jgi:hypothetical protein
MSMPLIPGMTLSPLSEGAPISESHLILHADKGLDVVVVIPIAARQNAGRTYFLSYKYISYREVDSALSIENPCLVQESFKPRPASGMADEDLNKKFKKHGQVESVALSSLKLRWQIVEPLVTGLNREILFHKEMLQVEVTRRANELAEEVTYRSVFPNRVHPKGDKSKEEVIPSFEKRLQALVAEIKRLLNQYWAGGSTRGALINFGGNCGGRGKRKKTTDKHLGRKSVRTQAGKFDYEALIIEPDDHNEEIIKHCIAHYLIRGVTVAHALRRMWTDFYSETVQLDTGKAGRRWLPPNQRPTRPQFEYRKTLEGPEHAAWRKNLAPNAFERNFRAVMGSATDDVKAVGQRGGIDASPIDFQLVKLLAPLERIGGAYRIILVDAMYGYIPGFYVGLDAPSSKTVKLAVHHALNPDKTEWLEGLGLEQDPNDWIPIHFVDLWADNTDLRSDEVMRSLDGIGTHIHFVPVRRADRNPMAESGHHVIHRAVDHKMHGSTYGRPRQERGEESAIDRARHTVIQAIRETARAVHTHNTMEIDVVRPLWMKERGVPPTRLQMTRATVERGKVAKPLCAYDTAHIHLLPRHQGTFTPKGIRLHMEGTGRKVSFIEPLAYVSSHPDIVRKVEDARRGGKHDPEYFRATFLVDPYAMRSCWYLNLQTMQIIPLNLKILGIDDVDLPYEATMHDVVNLMKADAVERPVWQEAGARKLGLMEAGQAQTKEDAEASYQVALAEVSGKKQSKAKLRANRAVNRDSEKAGQIHGMPVIVTIGNSPSVQVESSEGGKGGIADQMPSDEVAATAPSVGTVIPTTSEPVPPTKKRSLLRAVVTAYRKQEVPNVN